MQATHKGLKPFEQFGLTFTEEKKTGDNYYTDCPFSGSTDKFYINPEKGLWDSKNTGKSGNLVQFCRMYFELCKSLTNDEHLAPLSQNRKTPLFAFRGEVALNPLNGKYLIAYRNDKSEIMNVGHYQIGSELGILKTSGLPLYMIGEELLPTEPQVILDIYVMEGEWDFFIMKWLLARCGLTNAYPIGIPGAGNFKDSWAEVFKDHRVFVCYDNDDAGKQGCDKLKKKLFTSRVVKSISFLSWPELCEKGYDIRDHIVNTAGDILNSLKTSHVKTYNALCKMFFSLTPNERTGKTEVIPGGASDTTGEVAYEVTLDDVIAFENSVKEWLRIKNFDEFDIFIGSLLANKIPDGEPVWLLLVGPPGSKKTEMVMMLNKSSYVETTSTLTAPALISGFARDNEPSLIPKLNGRMLAVKDLTSILSGNPTTREDIFAILRDAYDGYVEKIFGSGVKKSFKSKFGFIGAVTNVIDSYQSTLSSLGERFIKLRLDTPDSLKAELEIIHKVLDNINKETPAREKIQEDVKKILSQRLPEFLPGFTCEEDKVRLIYMGVFVARLRATIFKNSYTSEQLVMAFHELGSRVSKVFAKLAMGIAMFRKHSSITNYELDKIKRVALDTVPDRVAAITKYIWEYEKANKCGPGTMLISNDLKIHSSTTSKLLSDLCLLETLIKVDDGKVGMNSEYRISPDVREIISKSGIFD